MTDWKRSRNVEVVNENFVKMVNPFFQPLDETEEPVIDYGSISVGRHLGTVNHNIFCKNKDKRRLEQNRWSMRIRKADVEAMESELRTLVEDQILDVEQILVKYEQSDDQDDMVSYGVGWFFFSD